MLKCSQFQTPNAEIQYRIIGPSSIVRYFGVASDGNIFISQPLTNDNNEGNYVLTVSIYYTVTSDLTCMMTKEFQILLSRSLDKMVYACFLFSSF